MRVLLLALAVILGCRRRHEIAPATHDRHQNDAAARDGAAEPDRVLDIDGVVDCVSSDALYVRTDKTVVRLSGAHRRTSFPLPLGLPTATGWTAGGSWVAWTERGAASGGDGYVRSWSLAANAAGPSYLVDDIEKAGPRIAAGRVVFRVTMPVCVHGAESCPFGQGLVVLPLDGTRMRLLGPEQYLWIPGIAVADDGIVAAFDFITSSPSIVVSGFGSPADRWPALPTTKKLASFSGTAEIDWPSMLAADERAVFFVGRTGIERIDRVGSPSAPRTLLADAHPEFITGLWLSPAGLVIGFGHPAGVTVVDPSTGRPKHQVVSSDRVLAAWAGEELMWCTRRGVFAVRP